MIKRLLNPRSISKLAKRRYFLRETRISYWGRVNTANLMKTKKICLDAITIF